MPALWAIGGAVISGGLGFLGSQSRNNSARSEARRQTKINKENYKYQWGDPDSDELGGEAKRKYDYSVEGLQIQKENDANNIAYQEAGLIQSWEYQAGRQLYEENQLNRIYERSVQQATGQITLNEFAAGQAMLEQDNFLRENLVDLAFSEQQTLLDYGIAAAGLDIQRRKGRAEAQLTMGAERGQAALSLQEGLVAAAEAKGAAAAAGQAGRSARKAQQAITAKAGAKSAALLQKLRDNQNSVVQQLLYTDQSISLDYQKLNSQLMLDKAQLAATADNLFASDALVRQKIKLEELQANINAENSIELKPEALPPIPKPFALPRPVYQDIYEPKKPKFLGQVTPQLENVFLSTANAAISGAQAGLSIGPTFGMKYPG